MDDGIEKTGLLWRDDVTFAPRAVETEWWCSVPFHKSRCAAFPPNARKTSDQRLELIVVRRAVNAEIDTLLQPPKCFRDLHALVAAAFLTGQRYKAQLTPCRSRKRLTHHA